MNIETIVEILKRDIEYIKCSLGENKSEHNDIMNKIDSFIIASNQNMEAFKKEAEKKFASKVYEDVMKVAIGLILTSFFIAVLALVFK